MIYRQLLTHLSVACFLTVSLSAHGFIERKYSLEEVLTECTNVVFGTVTAVNPKRMTVNVKVDENIKGKSDFDELKINLSTGQGNFPQKMVEKFEADLPIIIFYAKNGATIDCLGHVNSTWFQLRAIDERDKNRVWWNFTHIEIYMHRTYNGPTPAFQKLVRDVLAGKKVAEDATSAAVNSLASAPANVGRVLMLTGNQFNVEFPVISGFSPVNEQQMAYKKTTDRNLPELEYADILWIGQGEISEGSYWLTREQEEKIKAFVKRGGVAIVLGQDSDDNRPCGVGWIPEPMKGVERTGRSDLQQTPAAGGLFSEPNRIQSGDVFIDDTWTAWSDRYTVLATTNGGKEIAVAMLEHGNGMYLVTSFQNETNANIFVNQPMMQNLLHFAVNWLNRRG